MQVVNLWQRIARFCKRGWIDSNRIKRGLMVQLWKTTLVMLSSPVCITLQLLYMDLYMNTVVSIYFSCSQSVSLLFTSFHPCDHSIWIITSILCLCVWCKLDLSQKLRVRSIVFYVLGACIVNIPRMKITIVVVPHERTYFIWH